MNSGVIHAAHAIRLTKYAFDHQLIDPLFSVPEDSLEHELVMLT
jgi:hypothetical protein